jgi:hypothetical protein
MPGLLPLQAGVWVEACFLFSEKVQAQVKKNVWKTSLGIVFKFIFVEINFKKFSTS